MPVLPDSYMIAAFALLVGLCVGSFGCGLTRFAH
jgi:hypothetical protein